MDAVGRGASSGVTGPKPIIVRACGFAMPDSVRGPSVASWRTGSVDVLPAVPGVSHGPARVDGPGSIGVKAPGRCASETLSALPICRSGSAGIAVGAAAFANRFASGAAPSVGTGSKFAPQREQRCARSSFGLPQAGQSSIARNYTPHAGTSKPQAFRRLGREIAVSLAQLGRMV